MSQEHRAQTENAAGAGKLSRIIFLIVSVGLIVGLLIALRAQVADLTFTEEELAERKAAAEKTKKTRRRKPKAKKEEEKPAEPGTLKNLPAIKQTVKKPPETWLVPLMGAVAAVTLLAGVLVAALLKLFGYRKVPYQPVSGQGYLDAANMERAVEIVTARCRHMGFETEVKVGLQEGEPDPEAKGTMSFVEHTTVRGFAQGRMGAIGPEEHDRAIEVHIDREGDRFSVTATAWLPGHEGRDHGDTEYCRERVEHAVGKKVSGPVVPGVSFLSCLALGYGVLATLPVLMSQMELGKYQCLGWAFFFTAASMAVLTGLAAVVRIALARRHLYGLTAAVGGLALGLISVLIALTVEKLIIVQ